MGVHGERVVVPKEADVLLSAAQRLALAMADGYGGTLGCACVSGVGAHVCVRACVYGFRHRWLSPSPLSSLSASTAQHQQLIVVV